MTVWRLVSDVGGSNVRFARCHSRHDLADKRAYATRDFPSFYAALDAYLAATGGPEGCELAAIGVAGPIDRDHVKLTNSDWTIEAAKVEAHLGGGRTKLVNDLEAVALALPHLREEELAPIGGGRRDAAKRGTMLALAAGTGFGGAMAFPSGDDWASHPGEPGHMSIGARSPEELTWIGNAHSVENILSGRGVAQLYERVAGRTAAPAATGLDAAEIFARAGEDEFAAETVRVYSTLLGRVAGDLVLAAAAWGGVYLCGSVVGGWAATGGRQYFRAPFEDKGAMSERMKQVYSGIITRDDVALVGLTYLSINKGG